MKAISEYLKLVPRVIPNLDKFIEGNINDLRLHLGNISEEKREIILERRVICEGCPFMSENAKTSHEYFDFTKQYYNTNRKDKHCTFCGCPIDTRTASLESNCGAEYHNITNPSAPKFELKWKKVN